jgi:hypothetical protein
MERYFVFPLFESHCQQNHKNTTQKTEQMKGIVNIDTLPFILYASDL